MKINIDLIWTMLYKTENKLLASGNVSMEEIKDLLKTVLEVDPEVIQRMKWRKAIYFDENMITWSDECTLYRNEVDEVYKEGNILFLKTNGNCFTAYYVEKEKGFR